MLTASLHRYPDPVSSPDPAVQALVSQLASLEVAPEPAPEFKAALRARLVAAATGAPLPPGLQVDDAAEQVPAEDRAEDRTAPAVPAVGHRNRNQGGWRRPVAVGVSSLAAVLLVLSALVWLSGSALPGGPLYQVKRAAESVQLALTSGSDAKARLELQFAKLRSDEVAKLISRPSALGAGPAADASIGSATASLIRTTLVSADEDVREATRLLTQAALHSHTTAPLAILADWAPGQRKRLGEIADRLPAGSLRALALQSAHVVEAAKQRVIQVTHAVRCNCRVTKGSDSYGPVPCGTCSSTGSAASSSASAAVTSAPVPGSATSTVPVPGSAPGESTTPAPYDPGVPAPVDVPSSGGSDQSPSSAESTTDPTTDPTTDAPPTSSTPAPPSDSSQSSLPSVTPTPSSPSGTDPAPTSTDTLPDPSSAPLPSVPSLSGPTYSSSVGPSESDLPPTCVPTGASGPDGC